MKHKASCLVATRAPLPKRMRQLLYAVTAVSSLMAAGRVEAASQTWTNAPVTGEWTNVLNWVAKAVPGALGVAGGAQNADIVTFTNPLPISGIGGGASPILNDNAREVNGFIFDGTNCGAYVIGVAGVNTLWLSATLFPGGSINVNPAVTNPIAFYAETHFRLQSSQNGGYNITNNATSPNGTLYFDVLWADTASSRPLTLTLAGSNTGTNTIRHIDDNAAANGAYHLVKEGSGTWILPQANDIPQKTSGGDGIPASVAVNNGLLIVQDAGSLGTITAANLTVTNTGVLQIDGVSLNNTGITLRNGGTVRMNGTAVINGITMANTVNTVGTLATTHASDVVTVGNAVNKVTGGAATTTLRMTGPGTILYDAANNYIGKFSVDSGTNQIIDPNAFGLAANYNISAGGVLDVTPLTTFGATYSLTTKAFSANGTGTTMGTTAATIYLDPTGIFDFGSKPMTLTYTPAATNGDALHPALFAPQGVLNFNGNAITVVNTGSLPLNAGTYQIGRAASGTVTSSGAFVTIVAGAGVAPGMVGEIVTSGGNLNLLVYAYTPKGLVWTGNDPLVPGVWDRQLSTNWLNGATPSVFNIYDTALFNVTGIAQPNVNLASILVPGAVTVDASAGNYTLTGAGQIAGGTSLIKVGAGTLFLNTANTYSGGTVISNGIIKLGINDAIPSTGLGDVTNVSPAVLDLAGNNDTIGALNGNGTVDASAGASVLTVGANDNSGTFTGILTNSAGTLGITKVGLGTQVITRSNSYAGNTDIELGTLRVTDPYSIGGGASPLVMNGGTLDVATNLFITSLAGTGGTIVNNAATTNMITVTGGSTTTFGGSINTGTGKFALTVLGGSLRMLAANTYSNGTFVGSGATFQIHNSPASVTGALVASNTATLGLSGGSSSPGTPTTVTTVDGAAITLTSGAEGEIWGGLFIGSATSTNRFTGPVSVGGIASFSNFLGVVQFALTTGNFRFFNGAGSGGDNTMFEFVTGNVHTRDAQTVSLGAVRGGTSTSGIGGNGTAGSVSTWAIGAKNQNNFFEGYINGSNNVVKMGSGTLQLDGTAVVTNTDNATYTNYLISPLINYLGTTTVSNGVLTVVAPNSLTNCTSITLALPGAVLDASQMGYVSNQLSVDDNITPTNSYVVTNGILVVPATTFAGIPQTLAGFGTVKGSGTINYGTINPGNATTGGTLSISNGLTINAGSTNIFDLSDDLTGLVKASDSLTVQGNVTLSGASIINIGALNGALKAGKYTLIKYSGNLINEGGVVPNGPISNFTLSSVFKDTSRATMVLSNAPGEVDLVVVSLNAKNLVWTGDGVSNRWDLINSFTFSDAGTPSQFYQLDFVTFDNSAANFNVSLQGTLVPSSITVSNVTAYAFGGGGSISGPTGLLKTGPGTLLLTNAANSFTGGTVISNGLLSVGADSGNNQNDLALGTGPVTVSTAGAELRFGGNGGAVVNHSIANAIILNGGTVKAQDGIQHLTNSTVTVAAGGGSLVTVFATKNLILDSPLQGTGNVTIAAVQAGTNAIGGQVILSNALNTISGTVAIATNGNLALIGNAGLSNSPAIDVQTGGVLDVTVRSGGLLSIVSGQTLKGNGVIRGNLNLASGSTLSPGVTSALGTLSATNAATGVNFAGTTVMELNRAVTPNNSDRLLSTSNQFGGTLTVNNIGGTLLLGDSFTLFTSTTNRGAFTVTNLPTLTSGLGWSNSLVLNGKLTVISISTVNTNAFILTNSVSGNVLTLTWPLDHTGYRLQVQTNSLANGLKTNWVDVPGTTSVNTTNFIINLVNGTVFYRLVYP